MKARSIVQVARLAALTALVIGVGVTGRVRADVQPGDKIGPDNVDKVKDLISPGLEWCVRRGMPMTIVAPKKIEWPAPYKEATEKYAAQVKLAEDGLRIENYIAGQPFPNIDPNDPMVAFKIMWNFEHKPAITDDLDLRNGETWC